MNDSSILNLIAGGSVGALGFVILLYLKWNAKKKNETEEGELNVAQMSLKVMKETLLTLQNNLDLARKELKTYEQKLDIAQATIDDLKEQLSMQLMEMSDKDGIIQCQSNTISKLTKEIDQLKSDRHGRES